MKRNLAVLLSAVLISSTLAGCASESGEALYSSGTYEAVAKGFGGDVKVSITVDDSSITDVTVIGDGETDGIGSKAVEELPAAILEAQSAEVDGVAGATVTSNAIKSALNAALALARGESTEVTVKMAPGTYTADAQGFAKAERLTVHVTVNETAIEKIEIDQDNGETKVMLASVEKNLLPRMLELQSVSVDSITGATVSSSAVKSATEAAIIQALEAGGSDASAISAFYVDTPVVTVTKVIDTEVLVIGMGGSGIAAATSAAEEMYAANGQDASKVKVFAIDKAGKYGGTSAITSAPMAVNPPSMVAKTGKDFVDVDVFRADWLEFTEGDAKEEMIEIMIDKSGETIDWLMSLGFLFAEPDVGFGTPYRVVSNYGEGRGTTKETIGTYFDTIIKRYTEFGGEYLLETDGTKLITDANGVVIGAEAVGYDGTKYTINADAVILAGGGFIGNDEMLNELLSDEYYPLKGDWNKFASTQNDGSTIQMALDIDAGTYNISVPPMTHIGGADQIMHAFEVNKIEGEFDKRTGRPLTWSINDIPMIMAVAPDTMAVDKNGNRFTDESGLQMLDPWKAGPNYYTIWSDERIKNIEANGFEYANVGLYVNQGGVPANTAMPQIYEVLDKAIEMGYVYKADTIEDLASQIGIDSATLAANVASYDAYCATGTPNGEIEKASRIYNMFGEDLGEAHYLKPVGAKGPFYAVAGAPYSYSTTGGLNINEKFEVLKSDGTTVIPGLYAVGTDSMGVLFTEKKEYVKYGGAAQGWAFTSGREAGKLATQYALSK